MLCNAFFVYRTLNTDKVKYSNFLQDLGRGPKQNLAGRLSGDFIIHKLEKKCW